VKNFNKKPDFDMEKHEKLPRNLRRLIEIRFGGL